MGKVLETKPREQSGGDSYNRFEYQVHNIAYRIVGLIENEGDEIIFCEFHDDFAQVDSEESEIYDFYQVKTRDDGNEWTISGLTERRKKPSKEYKSTFLGRMFNNYLLFGNECRHCYFLSNEEFCEEIREWNACAQDSKRLKDTNPDLYETIKSRILPEFNGKALQNFNETFEDFINKSMILKSDLLLDGYEDKVKLAFLDKFAPYSIPINALNVVYSSILDDVRKKSKTKIQSPISKTSLIQRKGIRIKQVRSCVRNHLSIQGANSAFSVYLISLGIDGKDIQVLLEEKRSVDVRMTNTDDVAFIQAMAIVIKCISNRIQNSDSCVRVGDIVSESRASLLDNAFEYVLINDKAIEVKIYERMQRVGISEL